MKLNFKKISAVLGSFIMAGATLGFAAAAAYPAPFVQNGVGNVAIVYGTGTGVSELDQVQAGNIQTSLAGSVTGGTITIDGESFKFEKTSTKFHLGDNITGVVSTALDDDHLPTVLAAGKYIDDDNDEIDYSQKIAIGAANQLTMFEDNDYVDDQPTVGFKIPNSQNVLTYTLTFEDTLLVTDMPTTDLPIMGKNYYVLSNDTTSITLLDSAASTVLIAGETKTLDVGGTTYTVSASIFDTANSKVKLEINGQTTNLLAATETQKLSDGAYVGVKEVIVQNFQGGTNQVEFSIGKGKLKITTAAEVQINDEAISGLTGTLTGMATNTLSSIAFAWAADGDVFVAEDTSATMPGFETVSLSFGGLNYPAEEEILVQQGGDSYAVLEDFPLKDGTADIAFLYGTTAGAFAGIGKDADEKLVTGADGANITFDQDTDSYFVISWSDGSDAESYLARLSNFVLDGSNNETDLQLYQNGAWSTKKSGAQTSDTVSIGNAEIAIYDIDRTGKNAIIANNSAGTNFHTLYSAEGLTVYLPYTDVTNGTLGEGAINASGSTWANTGLGHNATSFYLVMKEEDQNDNKYSGDWINVTVGWDSSTTAEVEVSAVGTSNADATSTEIGDTDVWRDFTYSALATEILYNKPSSGQDSVKLVYHGDEVAADVYISEADAVSSTGALGNVLIKDSEVSDFADRNLVIVGGSCINSAAATALGFSEPTCGVAFTAATGVSAGQFLIKGVADFAGTGKLALVVAGYNADDTVNAATYLINKDVDTSKAYKGTSGTEATLIVE